MMATKTVVCPDCESPLAPGRFSCSACGALVAIVASSSRSLFPTDAPVAGPAGPTTDDAPLGGAEPIVTEAEAATPEESWDEPGSDNGHDEPAESPIRPEPPTWPEPLAAFVAAPPDVIPAVSPEPPPEATGLVAPLPDAPAPAATSPRGPMWTVESPHPETPASDWPPSIDAVLAAPPIAPPAPRNPAGAYLPPSAVLPPAEALPLPGAAAAAAAARPAAQNQAGQALSDAVSNLSMPSDPAVSFVAAGAAIAAIGFLLPWADVVLGSGSIGGFLDRWGLAGPGHPVIFVLLIALAAVALFNHRLPRWMRPGLPAVGLGFLLVGVAWPYLFGPFGATVGVYVVAAGALIAILAGTVDLILSRHSAAAASV